MKLSLFVGVVLLGVKTWAYIATNSLAVFSDFAESVVHVLAVAFALFAEYYAQKPADKDHAYGHDKISFFSAGLEGALVSTAGLFVGWKAVEGLLTGSQIGGLELGIWLTAAVVLINSSLGGWLLFVGRTRHSLVVEANAKHVLSDAVTSGAVLVGLVIVEITGITMFDGIVALVAAVSIFISGARLVLTSLRGLMDVSLPEDEAKIVATLNQFCPENASWHALRHRRSGMFLHVDFHFNVPDDMPVVEAHLLATTLERRIADAFQIKVKVISHIEPKDSHNAIHSSGS